MQISNVDATADATEPGTNTAPVALVTGGARRIGAAIVRALHGAGLTVIVHYGTSEAEAHALVAELNALRPDSAAAVAGDLAASGGAQAVGRDAVRAFGRLDVLVNSAARFYPTPLAEVTEAGFADLLHTNLRAPLLLAQACAPALATGAGVIINLVDIYASRPLPNHPVYSASKAALVTLTQALAWDLGPAIRVNGVAPGAILWPGGGVDEAYRQSVLAKTPLARAGEPSDIARTVAFLATEAPFITGQIVAVDGGRSLVI